MNYVTSKMLLLCAFVIGLYGCAAAPIGKDFPMQKTQEFTLGKTTKKEVTEQLGAAAREETRTFKKDLGNKEMKNGAVTQILEYSYGERESSNAVMANVRPYRKLVLYFIDDVLIGYFRISSFKSDSTDFDLSKASAIVKNKTTEQEVMKLLGAPGGGGIYPFSVSPNSRSVFYDVTLVNHPVGSTTRKQLTVHFFENGVVSDFSADSKTVLNPVVPVTTVPVYIPMRTR